MKIRTLLVPLDGSAPAEAALPIAEELLRENPDATLVLLRAARATTLPGVDPVSSEVDTGAAVSAG